MCLGDAVWFSSYQLGPSGFNNTCTNQSTIDQNRQGTLLTQVKEGILYLLPNRDNL